MRLFRIPALAVLAGASIASMARADEPLDLIAPPPIPRLTEPDLILTLPPRTMKSTPVVNQQAPLPAPVMLPREVKAQPVVSTPTVSPAPAATASSCTGCNLVGWGFRWRHPSYCPPPIAPVPAPEPGKKDEPKKKEDGKEPFDPKARDQLPADAFAGATETGTQPGGMFNSNMFGDRFGIGAGGAQTQTSRRLTAFVMDSNAIAGYTPNLGPGQTGVLTFTPFFTTPPASIFGAPLANFPIFTSQGPVTINNGPPYFPNDVPLLENAQVTQAAATLAQSGETVLFVSGFGIDDGTTAFPVVHVEQTYDFVRSTTVRVPLPVNGGVVGRTKISDNNSPLPRDRFILDYDLFGNTPLRLGGIDVHRFSPGIEKTFLDGLASIELRFPFASTVDTNSVFGGVTGRAGAFGDIHFTLKGLLYSSDTVNVAAGLGIGLPTGDDTAVQFANGVDLIKIKNQSVLITPYIAGLFTPTERFFAQAWAELDFDANGSTVYANPTLNGLQNAGRLYGQTLLQLDTQIGYWLRQDPTGQSTLTGLATFLELHYNTTLNDAGSVRAGSFSISSLTNRVDELNMTFGFTGIIGDRLNLMTGIVVPLRGGDDKYFDYQFAIRMNYFFGPNVPPRAYMVSN